MNHYKSWAALNKQLTALLCEEWRDRISYFLTFYHRVHNVYGRVAIRLDGRELVCFSWTSILRQDSDLHQLWEETGRWDHTDPALREAWNRDAVYCEMDFLDAATAFLNLPIEAALESDDYIIHILAILDRRTGRRTLERIRQQGYQDLPPWVKQFYDLRLSVSSVCGPSRRQSPPQEFRRPQAAK